MVRLMTWAQHIFTLRATRQPHRGAHWVFRLHLFMGMSLFVIFPSRAWSMSERLCIGRLPGPSMAAGAAPLSPQTPILPGAHDGHLWSPQAPMSGAWPVPRHPCPS